MVCFLMHIEVGTLRLMGNTECIFTTLKEAVLQGKNGVPVACRRRLLALLVLHKMITEY